MTNDTIIKILIIEDQRDLREGLQRLVNVTPGFKCAGAFRTAEEAIARVKHDVTDVVLTDIGLPASKASENSKKCSRIC